MWVFPWVRGFSWSSCEVIIIVVDVVDFVDIIVIAVGGVSIILSPTLRLCLWCHPARLPGKIIYYLCVCWLFFIEFHHRCRGIGCGNCTLPEVVEFLHCRWLHNINFFKALNPVFVLTNHNVLGLMMCWRKSSKIYFHMGVSQYMNIKVPDIELV